MLETYMLLGSENALEHVTELVNECMHIPR